VIYNNSNNIAVSRDSVVYVATRYGPDGLGIEYLWERDFPQTSIAALWPTQPPVQRVTGLSRE